MTQFLSLLLNGVSLGAMYALIALGFVIIFKSSGVVNFAHGSFLLLGAYAVVRLSEPLGFWAGALAGVALTAAAAWLIERLVLARLRGSSDISLAVVTIGIDILLLTDLVRRIGSDILNVPHPWGGDVVRLGDVGISTNRALAIGMAALLIGGFFAAFKYSSWGVAMRAVAEDGDTAALMGIRQGRVSAIAWLVAGLLAAVAALFLVGSPTPGVSPAVYTVALGAIPAAVLGGLDSTGGALAGGLLIGVAEALAAGYQDQLLFLGRGFGAVVPYLVMIVVLLVRPSGLFGTREMTRV
ncbi:branched-chain amino acid ABC transporter permease [Cryptosporangium aurantiacum]|uniref:Amino acid/amide ABC transporter membrane protein 1, HAAT family n=1 Tax=Cryptosporangium aurantiacum TaxID=134849 RepID=A0A1M7PAV3_9ACTN|nr:branched-chain amino acid ABC transporter permease [Cryptosporangium aurantiacum]SHN13902.1 amino acid/amide ABC transporter membrane protein 1, HAAT family [Cryptosporangium aurantiacum]